MRTKPRYKYNGRLVTIKELAEISSKSAKLISNRLLNGWTVEDAISKPIQRPKRYEYDGKCLTLVEWANEIGISENTIHNRVLQGLPYEEVFKPESRYTAKLAYTYEDIKPFLNQLSEKEKFVVQSHLAGRKHREIAKELGVTPQRVSKIERTILEKYLPEKC